MSIAYVNQILPKDTAQVSIPNFAPIAGSVIQYKAAMSNTATTLAPGSGDFVIVSFDFTPKSANSIIRIHWSHGQTTKVSGAGTASWFSAGIKVDGVNQREVAIGALGYPEGNADQRYMPSKTGYISSWSGQKTISHYGNVGSTNSNWIINHQEHITHLEVMEIAQ
jgi:hypothetical protein